MENFDVIIIGGGPSGYAAAMRAIDLDKKVCLIEKNKIGGAAIYNGALSERYKSVFENGQPRIGHKSHK